MNFNHIICIAVAMLMTIVCPNVNANASSDLDNNNPITAAQVHQAAAPMHAQVDGGPRDIIHCLVGVTVLQSDNIAMEITVTSETGETVYHGTSSHARTTIPTSGWSSGNYTVEINDDSNNHQEATITVN